MADTKLTALTELTAPALDDWLYAVDKSDTTDDAAGSSRKILNSSLMQYMPHGLSEISVTGATTATIGRMHVCSGTTSDYTLTLPAASGNTGKVIVVRMATGLTKLVTIDGNASETIDGSLTRIMWAGESAILLCDGSNWFKIGGKSIPMMARIARATALAANFVADTYKLITCATSVIDNTGVMVDTGNNKLIVRRSAIYTFIGAIQYNAGVTTGNYCEVSVTINGSSTVVAKQTLADSGVYTAPVCSSIYSCVANDELFLYGVTQGSGANLIADAGVNFLSAIEVPAW